MLTIFTYNTAMPVRETVDRDPGALTLAFGALRALRRSLSRLGNVRSPARPPVPFAWL